MAAEPMVRRISLPPSIEIAPLDRFQAAQPAQLPPPPVDGSPVVGIIDGGVADIPPLAPGAPAAPIRSTRPIAISHTARSSPVSSPAPGR